MNEKNYNENTVVTAGILKEALVEVITKPIQDLKGDINAINSDINSISSNLKLLREEFNAHVEMTSRITEITMNEFSTNRKLIEHLDQQVVRAREDLNMYRQEVRASSRTILRNERNIEDLDGRALKLEMVK